jgi:hypothetical protein
MFFKVFNGEFMIMRSFETMYDWQIARSFYELGFAFTITTLLFVLGHLRFSWCFLSGFRFIFKAANTEGCVFFVTFLSERHALPLLLLLRRAVFRQPLPTRRIFPLFLLQAH